VRRSPGIHAVYCSNYSCGPDSFNLHFVSYAMQGKPLAIIETDGHSGDAGTKTRIEAFLYCVRQEQRSELADADAPDFRAVVVPPLSLKEVRDDEVMLVPRLGPGSEAVTAAFRGLGIQAEDLPWLDAEMLKLGRRHTSGKECVPATMTLGTLLHRLEQDRDTQRRFVLVMPASDGPCRFGVYNLLDRIVLERLGWKDRVRVYSPTDQGYFANLPRGFPGLVVSGLAAASALMSLLLHVRPDATDPARAVAIHRRRHGELLRLIEQAAGPGLSLARLSKELITGRLFGIRKLLRDTAEELQPLRRGQELPTVLVVGEIYVRLNPFANDHVIEKLERMGIRARLAPLSEWIEYSDHLSLQEGWRAGMGEWLSDLAFERILSIIHKTVAPHLGEPRHRHRVQATLAAARPLVRDELFGEAVLTVGSALAEWRMGIIDGVLNVGPLECMPTKIAESQFHHAAQRENLLTLTLPVNGDPIDPQLLENFTFEVRARAAQRRQALTPESS